MSLGQQHRGDEGDDNDETHEEYAGAIQGQRSLNLQRSGAGLPDERAERCDQRAKHQDELDGATSPAPEEGLDQHTQHGSSAHDDEGQDREEVDRRCGHDLGVHCSPPRTPIVGTGSVTPTTSRVRSTAGLTTSNTGAG